MRIITQISLFDDTLNENLGDLERLQKGKSERKRKQRGKGCGLVPENIYNHKTWRWKNHKNKEMVWVPSASDIRCDPLKTDPRIFTKVARNSKKWKRLYKKRTSIERVNGRIDRDFQFEKHTIRGLEKMKMFLTVTFIIQLASAKAKIESGTTSGLAKHCAWA